MDRHRLWRVKIGSNVRLLTPTNIVNMETSTKKSLRKIMRQISGSKLSTNKARRITGGAIPWLDKPEP